MKEIVTTAIINQIKRGREDQGMSQSELSEKAYFSRTYVGQIERGDKQPSLESLVRIADALEIPFLKLFEDIPLLALDIE